MKKINSLLYREFTLMKKSLILNSVITVSLMILAWLVVLSCRIGNLSFIVNDEFTYSVILHICIFMIAFLPAMFICNNEVIEFDLKSGWRKFAMSIPVSPVEKALVKTIIKFIMTAAAFLIQFLNYTVICAISDRDFSSDYLMIFLLMIDVALLSDLIMTAFMLSAKNEKAIALSNASPLILMLPCLPITRHIINELQDMIGDFQVENPDEELVDEMLSQTIGYMKDCLFSTFTFVIPALAVIFAAGFIINAIILKRREK